MGDIPTSGWWPVDPAPVAAKFGIDAMPHDAWHVCLEAALRAEGLDPVKREQARAVWERTQEELEKELCHGPFTKDELDIAYGRGKWRAISTSYGEIQQRALTSVELGAVAHDPGVRSTLSAP